MNKESEIDKLFCIKRRERFLSLGLPYAESPAFAYNSFGITGSLQVHWESFKTPRQVQNKLRGEKTFPLNVCRHNRRWKIKEEARQSYLPRV